MHTMGEESVLCIAASVLLQFLLLRGVEKQWEVLNSVLGAPYRLNGLEGKTGGERDFLWDKNKTALIDGQNRSSEVSQRT